MTPLTHFTADGDPHMVDVSAKPITSRTAIAEAHIALNQTTLTLIRGGGHKKGDVIGVAQLAGIMGAKRTADLIPLCHPLSLTHIGVDIAVVADGLHITAECVVDGKTGVEMEALTAVSIAALTVYDMCKAHQKDMVIGGIRLVSKSGGQSGNFDAVSKPSPASKNNELGQSGNFDAK